MPISADMNNANESIAMPTQPNTSILEVGSIAEMDLLQFWEILEQFLEPEHHQI